MAASWDEQTGDGMMEGGDIATAHRARWTGMVQERRRETPRSTMPAGRNRLSRAVETEIVPRLLLGHRVAPARLGAAGDWIAAPGNVTELAACAVGELDAAADYIAGMRTSGASVEAVYLDLLAPAARRLGEMWEDDSLGFADVTIGLLRLHQVLRALAPDFRVESAQERQGRRALLVPGPGDKHSFGLAMVSEFFRRAGWGVWAGAPATPDELFGLVRGEWFGVIGFSVACEDRLEALASCIRRVRAASRNPSIGVMVGGPIFSMHPELALAVGADSTAKDARDAAFQAEGLLALQPAPR